MTETAASTKDRVLDAAEELFSQQGFVATSLREITSRAGVNLAAIHYHFGSKDALIAAVFRRRIAPLNEERLRLLGQAEAREGGPDLEGLVHALVAPAIRLGPDRGASVMSLMGRLHAEPPEFVAKLFQELFVELRDRFMPAFQGALAHLEPAEVYRRIHFLVGSMAHTMCGGHLLETMSGGVCGDQDADAVIAQLVQFGVGGLRASRTRLSAKEERA